MHTGSSLIQTLFMLPRKVVCFIFTIDMYKLRCQEGKFALQELTFAKQRKLVRNPINFFDEAGCTINNNY